MAEKSTTRFVYNLENRIAFPIPGYALPLAAAPKISRNRTRTDEEDASGGDDHENQNEGRFGTKGRTYPSAIPSPPTTHSGGSSSGIVSKPAPVAGRRMLRGGAAAGLSGDQQSIVVEKGRGRRDHQGHSSSGTTTTTSSTSTSNSPRYRRFDGVAGAGRGVGSDDTSIATVISGISGGGDHLYLTTTTASRAAASLGLSLGTMGKGVGGGGGASSTSSTSYLTVGNAANNGASLRSRHITAFWASELSPSAATTITTKAGNNNNIPSSPSSPAASSAALCDRVIGLSDGTVLCSLVGNNNNNNINGLLSRLENGGSSPSSKMSINANAHEVLGAHKAAVTGVGMLYIPNSGGGGAGIPNAHRTTTITGSPLSSSSSWSRIVVTGSADGTIRLWAPAGGSDKTLDNGGDTSSADHSFSQSGGAASDFSSFIGGGAKSHLQRKCIQLIAAHDAPITAIAVTGYFATSSAALRFLNKSHLPAPSTLRKKRAARMRNHKLKKPSISTSTFKGQRNGAGLSSNQEFDGENGENTSDEGSSDSGNDYDDNDGEDDDTDNDDSESGIFPSGPKNSSSITHRSGGYQNQSPLFSPNVPMPTIISGSVDKTIKVWQLDPQAARLTSDVRFEVRQIFSFNCWVTTLWATPLETILFCGGGANSNAAGSQQQQQQHSFYPNTNKNAAAAANTGGNASTSPSAVVPQTHPSEVLVGTDNGLVTVLNVNNNFMGSSTAITSPDVVAVTNGSSGGGGATADDVLNPVASAYYANAAANNSKRKNGTTTTTTANERRGSGRRQLEEARVLVDGGVGAAEGSNIGSFPQPPPIRSASSSALLHNSINGLDDNNNNINNKKDTNTTPQHPPAAKSVTTVTCTATRITNRGPYSLSRQVPIMSSKKSAQTKKRSGPKYSDGDSSEDDEKKKATSWKNNGGTQGRGGGPDEFFFSSSTSQYPAGIIKFVPMVAPSFHKNSRDNAASPSSNSGGGSSLVVVLNYTTKAYAVNTYTYEVAAVVEHPDALTGGGGSSSSGSGAQEQPYSSAGGGGAVYFIDCVSIRAANALDLSNSNQRDSVMDEELWLFLDSAGVLHLYSTQSNRWLFRTSGGGGPQTTTSENGGGVSSTNRRPPLAAVPQQQQQLQSPKFLQRAPADPSGFFIGERQLVSYRRVTVDIVDDCVAHDDRVAFIVQINRNKAARTKKEKRISRSSVRGNAESAALSFLAAERETLGGTDVLNSRSYTSSSSTTQSSSAFDETDLVTVGVDNTICYWTSEMELVKRIDIGDDDDDNTNNEAAQGKGAAGLVEIGEKDWMGSNVAKSYQFSGGKKVGKERGRKEGLKEHEHRRHRDKYEADSRRSEITAVLPLLSHRLIVTGHENGMLTFRNVDFPRNFSFRAHDNSICAILEGFHRREKSGSVSSLPSASARARGGGLLRSSFSAAANKTYNGSSGSVGEKVPWHHIATISFDGCLALWDAPRDIGNATARCELRIRVSSNELLCAAYEDLNCLYIVGDSHGEVTVWSPTDQLTPLHRLNHLQALGLRKLRNDNDGLGLPRAHAGAATSLVLDGNYLFSAGDDGSIYLWNLLTGDKLLELSACSRLLEYDPTINRDVLLSFDDVVSICRLGNGDIVACSRGSEGGGERASSTVREQSNVGSSSAAFSRNHLIVWFDHANNYEPRAYRRLFGRVEPSCMIVMVTDTSEGDSTHQSSPNHYYNNNNNNGVADANNDDDFPSKQHLPVRPVTSVADRLERARQRQQQKEATNGGGGGEELGVGNVSSMIDGDVNEIEKGQVGFNVETSGEVIVVGFEDGKIDFIRLSSFLPVRLYSESSSGGNNTK